MTVLDAQAVVALLLGEPAAHKVATLIERRQEPAVISAINVAELVDVLVRAHDRSSEDVTERVDWLVAGGLEVVPVTEEIGRSAGLLRSAEYHRVRRPLSLADCVALATALGRDEALATADRPLSEAARSRGVRVHRLPHP